MEHLTIKSSTIFVAADGGTKVYRSMDDVPEPLRSRVKRSTESTNSRTILIADRKGREELIRAIQGQPDSVSFRVTETARQKAAVREAQRRWSIARSWLELGGIGLIGLLLWLLFLR